MRIEVFMRTEYGVDVYIDTFTGLLIWDIDIRTKDTMNAIFRKSTLLKEYNSPIRLCDMDKRNLDSLFGTNW